jgi:hypothetical protein
MKIAYSPTRELDTDREDSLVKVTSMRRQTYMQDIDQAAGEGRSKTMQKGAPARQARAQIERMEAVVTTLTQQQTEGRAEAPGPRSNRTSNR